MQPVRSMRWIAVSLLVALSLAACGSGDAAPKATPTIDPNVASLLTKVVEQDEAAADAQTQIAEQGARADDQATTIAEQQKAANQQATKIAQQDKTAVADRQSLEAELADQARDLARVSADSATQAADLEEMATSAAERDATIAAQSTVIVAQATTISKQDKRISTAQAGVVKPTATKRPATATRVPTKRPTVRPTVRPTNTPDYGGSSSGGGAWPAYAEELLLNACLDAGEGYTFCVCLVASMETLVTFEDFLVASDYYNTYGEFPSWFSDAFAIAYYACM